MEEETDDSLRDDTAVEDDTAVVDEEDCMEEALAAVIDVDEDEDCCTAVVADFEAAAIMDEDSVLLFMEAETTDCF